MLKCHATTCKIRLHITHSIEEVPPSVVTAFVQKYLHTAVGPLGVHVDV